MRTRAIGTNPVTFAKAAPSLGIRCRVVPGVKGRYYSRADLERVLAAMEKEEQAALRDPKNTARTATR